MSYWALAKYSAYLIMQHFFDRKETLHKETLGLICLDLFAINVPTIADCKSFRLLPSSLRTLLTGRSAITNFLSSTWNGCLGLFGYSFFKDFAFVPSVLSLSKKLILTGLPHLVRTSPYRKSASLRSNSAVFVDVSLTNFGLLRYDRFLKNGNKYYPIG